MSAVEVVVHEEIGKRGGEFVVREVGCPIAG